MTKVKTILAVAGLSVLLLVIIFSVGCTDSADGREKITIKGYVTIENYGDPLDGVKVEIYRAWYDKTGWTTRAPGPTESDLEDTVKTDSDGYFSGKVPKLIKGEWYSLRFSKDGYINGGGSVEYQYQHKTNWVNCTLTTRTMFSGTVTDSGGAAVEGALVVLFVDYENLATKNDIRRTWLTDPSGEFNIPNVDDGVYDILVYKEGYEVAVIDGYDTHTEVVPEAVLKAGGPTPGNATIEVEHKWTDGQYVDDKTVVMLFDSDRELSALYVHDYGKLDNAVFSVKPGKYYVNVHCRYLETANTDAIAVDVAAGGNATVSVSGLYDPPFVDNR